MRLIKTSFFSAIAVAVKIATLFVINKILAIYVGPAGYAVIGQFQNAMQIITTFASGAINTGVIKYTAELNDSPEQQKTLWRTAGMISIIGSVIGAIFLLVFSQHLAVWLLSDHTLSSIFVWFAFSLILFTLNTLLLAILNGKKAIKTYVVANILGSICMLTFALIMSITLKLYGALLALTLYQSVAFFITTYLCIKQPWFHLNYLVGKIDKPTVINLSQFAAMALTAAICAPSAQIIIRKYLEFSQGIDVAGYWEAMMRLSSVYLLFITTTLSVYLLPKLSELKTALDIKKEIFVNYKLILPITALLSLLIYLFRDLIIIILFTESFLPMKTLFAWQVLGDTVKIASWILAYIMLSKNLYKEFILSEIVISIIWVTSSILFIDYYHEIGAVIAYFTTYVIYFFIVVLFVKKRGYL